MISKLKNIILNLCYVAIISFALSLLFSFIENPQLFMSNPFYQYGSIGYVVAFVLQTLASFSIFIWLIDFIKKQTETKAKILNSIPQSIVIYDWFGNISFMNNFAKETFGYSLDGNLNIMQLVSEKDRQTAINEIARKEEKLILGNWQHNYSLLSKSGREIDTTVYFSTYNNGDQIIGVCFDNSSLQETQEAYSKQIQFFWSLLNDLPTAIAYKDIDGVHRFVNLAYQKFIGKKEIEILGKKLDSVVAQEDFQKYEKKRLYAVESREEVNFESMLTVGNTKHAVNIEMVPRIIGGEVGGVFVSVKDITSEKIKEIALKKEIALNKAIGSIADLLSDINPQNSYDLINKCILKIRDAVGADRCYLLKKVEGNEFKVEYESVGVGQKPFEGFIIDMSSKEKDYYLNFIAKKSKLTIQTINSSHSEIKHFTAFKAKSVVEVSIPDSGSHFSGILGVLSSSNYVQIRENIVEFMHSVSHLLGDAMSRVNKISELRLSEETLNTLIDNTDIGIIIVSSENKVFYSNGRFSELFGYNPMTEEGHIFSMENLVVKEEINNVRESIKIREYKGTCSGTVKAKSLSGKEFWAKVYSARIDFEGSKAYLTTVIDVDEYLKKGDKNAIL